MGSHHPEEVQTPSTQCTASPSCSKEKGAHQVRLGEKGQANGGVRLVIDIDPSTGHPTEPHQDTFTLAIVAWIRDHAPIAESLWHDHDTLTLLHLITLYLLTYFDFDPKVELMQGYITHHATEIYKQWKYERARDYRWNVPESPVPLEFDHRVDQWRWLIEHFETPEFKRSSATMKALRALENKLTHSSGPVPFPTGPRDTGKTCPAPYVATFMLQYKKHRPKGRVEEAMTRRLEEEAPPLTDESSDTPPPLVELSLDDQAELFASQGLPSRGTRVPGFGKTPLESKKRGPKLDQCSSSSICSTEERVRTER